MSLKEVLFTKQQKEKLSWGDALGLWDIAKFKVIGLTQIEFFLVQAKDSELRTQLERGVEGLIIPHIEKIQGFLHAEGLEVPSVPQRKNLDVIGKRIEPNSFIQDDEIANSIREIYRLGLNLDMQSLTGAVREDVRGLIWKILSDDYQGFDNMVQLHKKKDWIIAPPTV